MQFDLKIVIKYLKKSIMKFWLLTDADSYIDNDNKKRWQQNIEKVHLKESAKELSRAKKSCKYWWFDGEKYKALPNEQIKIVKGSTRLC